MNFQTKTVKKTVGNSIDLVITEEIKFRTPKLNWNTAPLDCLIHSQATHQRIVKEHGAGSYHMIADYRMGVIHVYKNYSYQHSERLLRT